VSGSSWPGTAPTILATRDDVAVHQAYIADIEASVKEALASVDPVPYYMHYGENAWAGVKAHLDTVEAGRAVAAGRSLRLAAGYLHLATTANASGLHCGWLLLGQGGRHAQHAYPRPACLAGSASQMGAFSGGLSVRTIGSEAASRNRVMAIPVTIAPASPALAVHPADAAQHPSCPVPRMR
jgi:hypothetical protein